MFMNIAQCKIWRIVIVSNVVVDVNFAVVQPETSITETDMIKDIQTFPFLYLSKSTNT